MSDNGFTPNDAARESEWHKATRYDIATDLTASAASVALGPQLVDELTDQRTALIAYLLSKIKAADWHAVQDAASDIREINAKLDVLGA